MVSISFGLDVGNGRRKAMVPFPDFDPAARALLLRFRVTTLGAAQREAINDFVVAGKEDGWWDLLDFLYVPRFGNTVDSLMNWVGPAYPLIPVGAPVFNAVGVRSLAATDYFKTGFDPSDAGGNFQQDSCSLAIYTGTNNAGDMVEIGAGMHTITARSADDKLVVRCSSETADSEDIASSSGVSGFNRVSAEEFSITRNGVEIATPARASETLAEGEFYLCAQNDEGVAASPSSRFIGLAIGGGGLTPEQIESRDDAIVQLMGQL